MRRFLRVIILVPLAALILVFALANRQWVVFTLDPLGSTELPLAFSGPLFAFAFVFVIVGVILGGAAAWLRQGKWRRTARVLDTQARALRTENALLRRQLEANEPSDAPRLPYRTPAA